MTHLFVLGPGYVASAFCKRFKTNFSSITTTTRHFEKLSSLSSFSDNVLLLDKGFFPELIPKTTNIILFSAGADSFHDYPNTYPLLASAIKEAAALLPNLRHILYTSSISVYGEQFGKEVKETTPTHTPSPFTASLLEAENTLLSIPQKKVTILRLGEIIGPGRSLENKMKKIAGATLSGDGMSITNFSTLQDICNALWFCIQNEKEGIYNVVGDLHITRKDLYDSLCSFLNLEKVKWDFSTPSLHGSKKIVLSDKIKECGFSFET